MKKQVYAALLPAVLLLASACSKSLKPSSVQVGGQAKGYQSTLAGIPMSYGSTRITAFDNGSGSNDNQAGLNCLLVYDLEHNFNPEVVEVNGSTITTYPFLQDGHPWQPVSTSSATEDFPELGGDHVIAFDYYGYGRADHLIIYTPGGSDALGYNFKILERSSDGNPGHWNTIVWSQTGVGGYNLTSIYDKIIPYDMGNGTRNSLVCYRPGSGNFYAIQQQAANFGPGVTPNYVAVVKSTSGVPGFDASTGRPVSYDLRGTTDQILAEGQEPNLALICYRPGSSIYWEFTHTANSSTFTRTVASTSGEPGGIDLSQPQDRILEYDATYYAGTELWYRPGSGGSVGIDQGLAGSTDPYTGSSGFFGYPMQYNGITDGPSYIGDKFVVFNGTGRVDGPTSILCYAAGQNQVTIIEANNNGVYSVVY
ncbi:hypothetical protein [Dinghuibacter silviterrae]|uniref:Uncharacterized protein n=1 Tax=Dinghuibacter silviterrae TaxID=1539049 RepID=A0A4R8DV91_9BACT|nr:hypothetical protein [Dinghuibacter silviterrae]TDX02340.1 hypothetical protein EDB95_3398 [Dinghuibacter silviterrae]